jgi:glycogen debranching enzyme
VAASFERFWSARDGWCFDVIDGPDGDDATLRPNQILVVSLQHSPLPMPRARAVVDGGDLRARDSGYHQGPAWGWLLGPFAIAHYRVYGDAARAREFLTRLAEHLGDHGLGSIAEIFDGSAPFAPNGCIAQAWSVAETLRAWHALDPDGSAPRRSSGVS